MHYLQAVPNLGTVLMFSYAIQYVPLMTLRHAWDKFPSLVCGENSVTWVFCLLCIE